MAAVTDALIVARSRRPVVTAKVSSFVSPNLFSDNASLLFESKRLDPNLIPIPLLGAVTFVAERNDPFQILSDLAIACGKEAFSLIKATYGNSYKGWLFVSDGPWREATRIVLYHRLWKNHRNLVEADACATKSDEVEIKVDGNVRYAGVLEVTDRLIEKAIDSTRVCSSHAIIFSRRSDFALPSSIHHVFCHAFANRNGVAGTDIDWMNLAIVLCPLGDLLLRVSGRFDDHQAAVDVIGDPQNLPELK